MEWRSFVVVGEQFFELMMYGFCIYMLRKRCFLPFRGQKCEFWVLVRIPENTYLCSGGIIFCVQTTTKTIQL